MTCDNREALLDKLVHEVQDSAGVELDVVDESNSCQVKVGGGWRGHEIALKNGYKRW